MSCCGAAVGCGKVVRRLSCRLTTSVSADCSAADVQVPGEAQRDGDVVGRRWGLELVEEPQPLLGEGQGQVVRPVGPVSAVAGPRSAPVQLAGPDRRRSGPRRGRARQLHTEGGADAATSRVASREWPPRSKKSVVDADRSQAEHLGEQAARISSAGVRGGRAARPRGVVGCGQGLAVDLAVGGQRQRVQDHDGRRAPCSSGSRSATSRAQLAGSALSCRRARRRRRRAACRRGGPRGPRRRPRDAWGAGPAPPRSRPARCGSRGS